MILAGGRATRFGGAAKGLERIGSVRIIDRVAAALDGVCDRLLLVANAPDAGTWLPGARVAPDVLPGFGSLGGLHAALAHAGTAVVVVAWDMPFVPAGLLAALRTEGDLGATAVIPDAGSGPEPLCAYYARDCCPVAERLLRAGERRARALGDAVGARRFDAGQVARFGDPHTLFRNVNTPHDLDAARAHVAA